MRRFVLLLVLALATTTWQGSAIAAVSVLPDNGCPASEAIDARLDRLGALGLLSQLGSAEIRVAEPSLHVHFRDRRGESLGTRVVTATNDCEARAALAAAVIAAFAGEWAQTALAPRTIAPAVKLPEKASIARPWQGEVGAHAFAIYDGDEDGVGLGVRADLGRGPWLASVLVEGTFEREQPLGSGRGAYRFLRAGVGLGVRKQWSGVFWDVTLVPMVDRLSLAGKDLLATQTATSWGFAIAGQTRLGFGGWRLRPFLFAGASYRIPGERMTISDREVKVQLSALNIEAGLGISFRI